ncbi:MAG: lysine 2,3-aminomutase, partial [Kiritimatiellaeota bacterium]|nr:lysine 2,3-aminomutase [Kiritimatiellota bacterium]
MVHDWKWQIAHAIRSPEALRRHFPAAPVDEAACAAFPMCITPYYLGLIRRADFSDPVYAQCVPQRAERQSPPWLSPDPLGEERQSPVPGLFRRYPDRALLVTDGECAVKCRH